MKTCRDERRNAAGESKRYSSRRASVYITAMLFAVVIAISLGSFLKLSVSALNISQRSLYYQAALSLAEGGIDQAVWAYNNTSSGNWTDEWTPTGNERRATFSFPLDQGLTGTVKVWVQNSQPAAGTTPVVIAKSSITPPGGGPPVTRWLKINVKRDSVYAFGLVGKNSVTFNGQPQVDSYKSSKGVYGAALASGGVNVYDNGSVGVLSTSNGALSVGNASIWGTVAIGASSIAAISINNGTIGPSGSSGVTVSAVQTNFAANYPDAPTPSPSSSYSIGALGSTTLPRSGDTPASDGKYYYSITGLSLSGNGATLNVSDKVVLLITNPLQSISVSGQGAISVGSAASLEIYTPGDVSIAGNGVSNLSGVPSKLSITSTKAADSSGTQSISVCGNGVLSAIVYAPNANLSLSGGGNSGNVYGAMVGNNVTLNGTNARFHYDEDLASYGDNGSWTVGSWLELATAAEREVYSANLEF